MDKRNRKLIIDATVLFSSLALALTLIKYGYLQNLILNILPFKFLAEIVAGFLFTSFLTSPLSIAAFYVLSKDGNPFLIAFLGGLGAVLGDIIIVKIFRDSVFKDFQILSKDLKLQKIISFFHDSHFNHLAPLLGLVIIASPFPDELGLMLLGASKLTYTRLIILTYLLNTVGILLIILTGSLIKL